MGTHDESIGRTSARIGYWSAILTATFAIMYILAELVHLLGLLGAHDSAASLVVRFVPSLFLAMVFVVLMVAILHCVSKSNKIWAQIALAYAVIYAVLVSFVYYSQLTYVIPASLRGEAEQVALLAFGFGSFMFAVDILGYTFMSLATLFVAPVFAGEGMERWLRWILVINGCLAPFIALQIIYPPLWQVATIWGLSFPAAAIMLAIWFKRIR